VRLVGAPPHRRRQLRGPEAARDSRAGQDGVGRSSW
jgi:hypothetical protein